MPEKWYITKQDEGLTFEQMKKKISGLLVINVWVMKEGFSYSATSSKVVTSICICHIYRENNEHSKGKPQLKPNATARFIQKAATV
jgi:hypothetical protein